MNKFTAFAFCFVIVLGLLVLQGCGSGNSLGTTSVAGIVNVDGTPMEGVSVTFAPVDTTGRECYGTTDAKGKFTMTVPGAEVGSGAIPGEYRVMFSKMSDPFAGLSEEEIERKSAGGIPPSVNLLPEKYSNRDATDIAPVKVEKGKKNHFPFDLSTT